MVACAYNPALLRVHGLWEKTGKTCSKQTKAQNILANIPGRKLHNMWAILVESVYWKIKIANFVPDWQNGRKSIKIFLHGLPATAAAFKTTE